MELQQQNRGLHFDIASEIFEIIPTYLVGELNDTKMDACFTAFDKDG